MKRQISIAISSVLLLSALTACGSQTTMQNMPVQQQPILAQASNSNTFSFDKKDDGTEKKSSLKIKDLSQDIEAKKAEKLTIKLHPATNYMDERDVANMARYALRAMNASSSYSEGYRVGFDAIRRMARDGVYVARVSSASADATKDWQNGYKVLAAALNHMAQERPNTPEEACNLVLTMMNAANSYSDGYRAGLAALKIIGQTDNSSVRYIVDSAVRSAERTSSWENGYQIIRSALVELRRSF